MFAVVQSDGNLPDLRDFWKIEVRNGATSAAAFFNKWLEMLSGPDALLTNSPAQSLLTPSLVTLISSIAGFS